MNCRTIQSLNEKLSAREQRELCFKADVTEFGSLVTCQFSQLQAAFSNSNRGAATSPGILKNIDLNKLRRGGIQSADASSAIVAGRQMYGESDL